MSNYTVLKLKTDAQNHLHGTTLNRLPSFYSLLYEAARNILTNYDIATTKRTSQVVNAIYDDVYAYAVPSDLKGRKILDIRPQTGKTYSDNFTQWYSKEFSQYKKDQTFAIRHDTGVKTIQIAAELPVGITIDSLDSITGNGTWGSTGNAINLTADTIYKISGSASLKIGVSASGSAAGISNSTLASIDLSDYEDVGSLFMPVYFSTVTPVTSVSLKWGSSSSDYWTQTVTANHDGTVFQVGWNLLRFSWDGANETGSPSASAVVYVAPSIAYDGTAITTVRFDNILARLPEIYEIDYYSKFLFQNSSGEWIEEPSADTDIINLDTETYNLLLYEFGELVSQANQAEEAQSDLAFFSAKKKEAVEKYLSDNPSEAIRPKGTYYRNIYTRRR
jgi:hypothetical protein